MGRRTAMPSLSHNDPMHMLAVLVQRIALAVGLACPQQATPPFRQPTLLQRLLKARPQDGFKVVPVEFRQFDDAALHGVTSLPRYLVTPYRVDVTAATGLNWECMNGIAKMRASAKM